MHFGSNDSDLHVFDLSKMILFYILERLKSSIANGVVIIACDDCRFRTRYAS